MPQLGNLTLTDGVTPKNFEPVRRLDENRFLFREISVSPVAERATITTYLQPSTGGKKCIMKATLVTPFRPAPIDGVTQELEYLVSGFDFRKPSVATIADVDSQNLYAANLCSMTNQTLLESMFENETQWF